MSPALIALVILGLSAPARAHPDFTRPCATAQHDTDAALAKAEAARMHRMEADHGEE